MALRNKAAERAAYNNTGITNKLKVDQVVTIYHDPITQKSPEGKARLIRHIGSQPGSLNVQRWRVLFEGLDEVSVDRDIVFPIR